MIDDVGEDDLGAVLAIDLVSFHGKPEFRELHFKEELDRPWAKLRAFRENAVLVGYCLFWHVADEIHLIDIAVAPSAQRRGIGRALMADLLDYAKAHAVAKVLLEVRTGNTPAISLYETQGFERLRVRKGYYDDGEDGVEMMLAIDS